MPFTTTYIQTRLAISRLQAISSVMSDIPSTLANLQSLVTSGILDANEVALIISEYKQSIKTAITVEKAICNSEADIHAKASETETNKKMGTLTPIIAATPILISSTPPLLDADAVTLLADVPSLIQTLNNIENTFSVLN